MTVVVGPIAPACIVYELDETREDDRWISTKDVCVICISKARAVAWIKKDKLNAYRARTSGKPRQYRYRHDPKYGWRGDCHMIEAAEPGDGKEWRPVVIYTLSEVAIIA